MCYRVRKAVSSGATGSSGKCFRNTLKPSFLEFASAESAMLEHSPPTESTNVGFAPRHAKRKKQISSATVGVSLFFKTSTSTTPPNDSSHNIPSVTQSSLEYVGSVGAVSLATTNETKSVFSSGESLTAILESSTSLWLARVARMASNVHRFWDTQPVPGSGSSDPNETLPEGAIDEIKSIDDIRDVPLSLPAGFEWCDVDVLDDEQATEVYELLTANYVEDDDEMFRFDYKKEFLRWALTPPGYHKDWLVGVRNSKKGNLLAFISGIPVTAAVKEQSMPMAEINFLCVHKRLREKRLAPVLIKEVTRRVNRLGVWQAVYTAGVVLPRPVARAKYWHRSLNPKKLIEVGFTRLAPRMTMARTVKLYRVAQEVDIVGWRPMTRDDVPAVHSLLNSYQRKFPLRLVFSEEEVEHMFVPVRGVVDSFVVEDPSTLKITDFASFYRLPSTIIGNSKHSTLNVVYSFYQVPGSQTLESLMQGLLVEANKIGTDVFNALDLMENKDILRPLKFGPGDGTLHYYLYNWSTGDSEMESGDIGIVLL